MTKKNSKPEGKPTKKYCRSVSARLTDDQKRLLLRFAEANELTMSEVIRELVLHLHIIKNKSL